VIILLLYTPKKSYLNFVIICFNDILVFLSYKIVLLFHYDIVNYFIFNLLLLFSLNISFYEI